MRARTCWITGLTLCRGYLRTTCLHTHNVSKAPHTHNITVNYIVNLEDCQVIDNIYLMGDIEGPVNLLMQF